MHLLPKPYMSQAVTSYVRRFLSLLGWSKHGRDERLEIHFGSRNEWHAHIFLCVERLRIILRRILGCNIKIYVRDLFCKNIKCWIWGSHGDACAEQGDILSAACCLRLLVSFLPCSSTVRVEAICSSKTLGYLRITRLYNPEDRTLQDMKWMELAQKRFQ
jgi:hypothetical protein